MPTLSPVILNNRNSNIRNLKFLIPLLAATLLLALPAFGDEPASQPAPPAQPGVKAQAKTHDGSAKFIDGIAVYLPAQKLILVKLTSQKLTPADRNLILKAAPDQVQNMFFSVQAGKPSLSFRIDVPADAKTADQASQLSLAIFGLESAPANIITNYPISNPAPEGPSGQAALAGDLQAGKLLSIVWLKAPGKGGPYERTWDVTAGLPLNIKK